MAFTMSIDDFVISFFTTGPGVTNLSIEIYSMARKGINPSINALSTLMFVTVLILLLIVNRKEFTSRGDKIEKREDYFIWGCDAHRFYWETSTIRWNQKIMSHDFLIADRNEKVAYSLSVKKPRKL